eukprot:TRINITY_DN4707_c0_g1_i2.p1 TRINITY_DN4707_c0_g1~~TRINITY_DN4707_c0_g1_i2.p1  ORF type:complete len:177 (+),score=3.99 TRINITY_DN4707_c0_g1_i2:159-689(+)
MQACNAVRRRFCVQTVPEHPTASACQTQNLPRWGLHSAESSLVLQECAPLAANPAWWHRSAKHAGIDNGILSSANARYPRRSLFSEGRSLCFCCLHVVFRFYLRSLCCLLCHHQVLVRDFELLVRGFQLLVQHTRSLLVMLIILIALLLVASSARQAQSATSRALPQGCPCPPLRF